MEMEAADQQAAAATVTDADIQILRDHFPLLRELPACMVANLTVAQLVTMQTVTVIQYEDQEPVGSDG